jgi:hypothetical protein
MIRRTPSTNQMSSQAKRTTTRILASSGWSSNPSVIISAGVQVADDPDVLAANLLEPVAQPHGDLSPVAHSLSARILL